MPDDITGTDSVADETAGAPVTFESTVDAGADTASQEQPDTQTDLSQVDTGAEATPAPTQPQAVPQVHPEVEVWQKRYKDTQAWATQQAQRAKELERQWDGLDPQRVRQILDEHEKAKQQAQASPFTKQHPQYSANQERIRRIETFKQMAAGLDEEAVRTMAKNAGITDQDIQFYREAEQYKRQESERLLSDPRGYMTEVMEPIIQQKLQELDQFITGRARAQQWLSEPRNNEIVTKYAPDITSILDDSKPLSDRVAFLGERFSRLDALEKQLGSQVEKVSQAQAQSAALNTRAQGTTRRGTAPSTQVADGATYVSQVLKLKPSDPAYTRTLLAVNDNIRNGRDPSENL